MKWANAYIHYQRYHSMMKVDDNDVVNRRRTISTDWGSHRLRVSSTRHDSEADDEPAILSTCEPDNRHYTLLTGETLISLDRWDIVHCWPVIHYTLSTGETLYTVDRWDIIHSPPARHCTLLTGETLYTVDRWDIIHSPPARHCTLLTGETLYTVDRWDIIHSPPARHCTLLTG